MAPILVVPTIGGAPIIGPHPMLGRLARVWRTIIRGPIFWGPLMLGRPNIMWAILFGALLFGEVPQLLEPQTILAHQVGLALTGHLDPTRLAPSNPLLIFHTIFVANFHFLNILRHSITLIIFSVYYYLYE